MNRTGCVPPAEHSSFRSYTFLLIGGLRVVRRRAWQQERLRTNPDCRAN